MAGRRCPAPRCPRIITDGSPRCAEHQAAYEAKRGTSAARGYGAAHQGLRRVWQARIDSGEIIRCPRCGARITGSTWDLGHTEDRSAWTGPECVGCNRADGGRRGARAANDPGGDP